MADRGNEFDASGMFDFPKTLPAAFDATKIHALDPLYPALKREALAETPVAVERQDQAHYLWSRCGFRRMALPEWDWVRFVMMRRRDQLAFIDAYKARNALPPLPACMRNTTHDFFLRTPRPSPESAAAILGADDADTTRRLQPADQEEFVERLRRKVELAVLELRRERARTYLRKQRRDRRALKRWRLAGMEDGVKIESDTESSWTSDSMEDGSNEEEDDDGTKSLTDASSVSDSDSSGG